MAHLPSPASASSSTLIVTSLPSKESLQTDDIFASSHPSADQPARKMKLKPTLTISTTPPNAMPANEPKMSSKGFVEPHHGHLPRRSRKGTKAGANAKVEEKEGKPELSRGLTTSTVQGAVTSPVPVSATTAAPPLPRTPTPAAAPVPAPNAASTPSQRSEDAVVDEFPYSPPKTPPPPQHPYIPRHELLPPTYLTSLWLPATPPPAPLASSSGPLVSTPAPIFPLASATASANVNVNVNSPAFATPGSGRATPNLPRRRVSRKTQGRKASDAQAAEDAGFAAEKDERGERPRHVREAATAFDDTGGGAAAGSSGMDDVGSTSSQTSASPSASAGLGDDDGGHQTRSRSRSRSQAQLCPTSPTPAPFKLRARSQSRPRLTRTRHLSALGEDDDDGGGGGEQGASTPTSARLFVGQVQSRSQSRSRSRSQRQGTGLLPGARSRGVSLPRLRLGASPLRTSFAGRKAGDDETADDVFNVEKPRRTRKRGKERMCIQEVGRGSGVEVGFLDAEGGAREAVVEFWGLKESGDHTDRTRTRKVLLRVVDSSPSNGLGEGDASSSSSSTAPQDLERELELSLPDDLPSYIDGQPALSVGQIRAGCAFIARHLSCSSASSCSSSSSLPPSSSTSSTSTTRRKVRILTPVARPEDAMAIALCYLAYYAPAPSTSPSDSSKTKMQPTLLESLHNYFRDPSDSDTDIAFSLNTDTDADVDVEERISPWFESLSSAHLLYMRLLDEIEPRSEVRDPRGRETSRAFVPGSAYEEDVDVVGDFEEESSGMKTRGDGHGHGEEYAGIRTEWRGVLSFEGLMRVDEAGREKCLGEVQSG